MKRLYTGLNMMKIGFLGTGLMGQPMAQRLLEAGMEVIAYNRTQSKLEPLKSIGVEIANSPTEAIAAAECLILMLADAAAIENLLFLENTSIANRTIIQMGTIAPQESQILRDRVVAAGGEYLEAPVLGSIPEAKTGKLIVMVGSTKTQFDRSNALLKNFSSDPLYIGEVGTAAAMKLALNQLIASLTGAFALSLSFASKQGVNVEQFMQVLRQSALYAPTFDKKLSKMLDRNYANPNFPTKHLLKDTNLFITQAQAIDLDTSSIEGIRKLIEKAIELGYSEQDYSAIFSAIDN
ncbi:MAG: NAD(P)-dependent oxidoreductase [Xenococcaceae cyanobacterium]